MCFPWFLRRKWCRCPFPMSRDLKEKTRVVEHQKQNTCPKQGDFITTTPSPISDIPHRGPKLKSFTRLETCPRGTMILLVNTQTRDIKRLKFWHKKIVVHIISYIILQYLFCHVKNYLSWIPPTLPYIAQWGHRISPGIPAFRKAWDFVEIPKPFPSTTYGRWPGPVRRIMGR